MNQNDQNQILAPQASEINIPVPPVPVKLTTNKLSGLSRSGIITLLVGAGFELFLALILLIVGAILISDGINFAGYYEDGYYDSPNHWAYVYFLIGIFTSLVVFLTTFGTILLTFSVLALKKQTYSLIMATGILGIIMGLGILGLVGGILTLAGNTKNESQ